MKGKMIIKCKSWLNHNIVSTQFGKVQQCKFGADMDMAESVNKRS